MMGGGHVLVDAGLKDDVVALQKPLGLPKLLIETAQGRAPVARDIAARIEALGLVALALQHGQADQGLGAGQKDPALLQGIFVIKRNLGKFGRGSCHALSPILDGPWVVTSR